MNATTLLVDLRASARKGAKTLAKGSGEEDWQRMIVPGHRSVDPSRALNVTSRLRAAGCLPNEMVNEKETDHMATYRARSGEEVVLWA
jgi:hypothetical protein